jgi:hypothetical protein
LEPVTHPGNGRCYRKRLTQAYYKAAFGFLTGGFQDLGAINTVFAEIGTKSTPILKIKTFDRH